MKKTVKFTVDGQPRGKGSVRVTRQGFAYKDSKTALYENWIKLSYQQAHGSTKLDGEIEIAITAYYKIPKSTSKKRRAEMLAGRIRPVVKPDLDNISKSVCDALSGIAFDDDKQIVTSVLKKYYSENPRVSVGITGKVF